MIYNFKKYFNDLTFSLNLNKFTHNLHFLGTFYFINFESLISSSNISW